MIGGLSFGAQIAIFIVLIVLFGLSLWLLAMGIFKLGEKVEAVNRWRKATYVKAGDLLKEPELAVLRKLGKFNSGHFEVVAKVKAKQIIAPAHISNVKFWNHEKLKKEIDFVIFHKQKVNKDGEEKNGFKPVCAILCPKDEDDDWRKWLDDACMRAKIPLMQLKPDDPDDPPLHERVILAISKAGPIPEWVIDALKVSMAPKFPPETLK